MKSVFERTAETFPQQPGLYVSNAEVVCPKGLQLYRGKLHQFGRKGVSARLCLHMQGGLAGISQYAADSIALASVRS